MRRFNHNTGGPKHRSELEEFESQDICGSIIFAGQFLLRGSFAGHPAGISPASFSPTRSPVTGTELQPSSAPYWGYPCALCQYVLQHTATHCNTLQHIATHRNTPQHTATHCNTLQHIATQTRSHHLLHFGAIHARCACQRCCLGRILCVRVCV